MVLADQTYVTVGLVGMISSSAEELLEDTFKKTMYKRILVA